MIKNISKILLLLLIMAAGIYSQQGMIMGTVVDSAKNPVPDVNVKIKGSYIGTASDIDGKYTLNNVPEGEYTVSVSSIGYKTVEYTGIKIKKW